MTPLAPAPPANADFGLEDLLDPTNWFDPTTWTDIADQLFDPASLGLGDLAGGAAATGTGLDDLLQQSSQLVDGLFGQSDDATTAGVAGGDGDSAGLIGTDSTGGAAAVSTDTGEAGSPAGWLHANDETVDTDALTSASVPLRITAGTEPVVDISIGGGPTVPVLVDTGSAGLVIPWWEIGWQGIGWPTGLGVGAYSGGLSYFYITLPTVLSFGPEMDTGQEIVTGSTSVDAVLFTWPTTLQAFLGPAGADGVLGIGPNAKGPTPEDIVTMALPGDLNDGVLIDAANGVMTFGPNPLAEGISVTGAPIANLFVQINDGGLQRVSGIIDSGGVYGTMPSSALGTGQTSGTLPSGTEISVYAGDGQTLLYSYVTTATNSPTVTSGSAMNTGYMPFWLYPMYISNSPAGTGMTIFGCSVTEGGCAVG